MDRLGELRVWLFGVLLTTTTIGGACTRPNPAFFLDPRSNGDGPAPGADGAAEGPPVLGTGGQSGQDGQGGATGQGGTASVGGASGAGGALSNPDATVVEGAGAGEPPLDGPPIDLAPDLAPEVPGPDADQRTSVGLVAHFPFDQQPAGGATTITDRFGNTVTLRGPIAWSTMVPPVSSGSRSIQFNGADAYVDLTVATALRPTSQGDKTLALWYSSTRNTPTERTLIAVFNASENLDVGIQLGFNGTQLAAWRWGRNSDQELLTASPAGWHHAAYTYGGGTHRLYLDGVERASFTGRAPANGTLDRCKLGTYDQTIEDQKYQGFMQDVRIYNRALSAADIRTLAGLP